MFAVMFAENSGANPLAPDFVTMGVTLVVFLALLAILYFAAWGPILKGLKKREESILGARDEAVKIKRETEELRTKLNAEFASANDRIRAMMDEARRDADALKATEKAVGLKDAQVERDRAKREIETAKDQALQEIQQHAVKLASLMSSKAVRRNLGEDDHKRLVQESLDELKTTITKA
jgi:F-type H+-transporting ATPase subunit b